MRFLVPALLLVGCAAPRDVYRVRYGTFPDRCEECPIDAISASQPVDARGPFERDVQIDPSDVFVRATADPNVLCVDVQPSGLPHEEFRHVTILDVEAFDGAVPYPYAIDARTRQRLAVDASKLLDESNFPCDSRLFARRVWDDNLRKWHRLHPRR